MRDLIARAESIGESLVDIAAAGAPGRVNRPLVEAIAGHDLFETVLADDNVRAMDLCAIRHGLARSCTEAETAFAIQGLGGVPILRSGAEALRHEWIPRLRRGEAVAAFALTEPEAGSDAAALSTTAVADGEGWRLSGEKLYISNAPDADIYTVFARTTEGAGAKGVSAFAVPGDSPGLRGEAVDLIAPHPVGRLVFDGVFVPYANVLGDIDGGFRVAMATLDLFRPSVGAFALGMAESALRIAVEHAQAREAFGKPIGSFQGVSHQLADVRLEIAAAEHLVYDAAAAYDLGEVDRLTGLAAMAKLAATEAAQHAVDVAIQVLGARGLVSGSKLAHLYAEVRAPRIYEGTSEIQRNIIARELMRGPLLP